MTEQSNNLNLSYYLDLDILAIKEDINFLMSRVYQVIHGILVSNSWKHVGVCFPEWDKDKQSNPLGKKIRLFSDQQTLEQIVSNSGIVLWQDKGALKVFKVEQTPETQEYAIFKRDRIFEKTTKNYLARKVKRKEARKTKCNELINKEKEKENRDTPQNIERRTQRPPFVTLKSRRTSQGFSLFIWKEKIEKTVVKGCFNQYGFSSGENKIGLPMF